MVLLKYVHLIITFTVVLVGGGGATTTDDLLPYDDSLAWNDPPQLESTVDWTALPDLIPPDSNIFSLSSSDPFSIINLGFLGGEEEEEDAGEGSSNTDLLAGNQQPNECLVPIPPVGKERRRRHHLLLLGRDSEVCNGNGGNGNGNRNGNGIGANNGHSKPQPPPPETKAPSLEATVTAFDQANCPQQRPWFICSSKVISDSWRMLPSSWVLQRSTRVSDTSERANCIYPSALFCCGIWVRNPYDELLEGDGEWRLSYLAMPYGTGNICMPLTPGGGEEGLFGPFES